MTARWIGGVAIAAGVIAFGATPHARQALSKPQVGTARLSGQIVVNDATAQPIRRVILLLNGGDLLMARQTTTDDRGMFVFAGLPAGRYTLSAWRNGFVRDIYGNKRPSIGNGSPIIVAEGQPVNITMKMTRSAVITGMIVFGNIKPSAPIRVQPMQYQSIGGERRLVPAQSGGVSPAGGAGGTVDDRGVYRIYGLAPGEYVLAIVPFMGTSEARPVQPAEVLWATQQFQPGRSGNAATSSPPPPAAPPVGVASVYYPGTSDAAAASTITVAPGEERSGVDIPLLFVPLAKVEGSFVDPDGQPPVQVQADLAMPGPNVLRSVSVRTGPDGKFSATGVPPGHYTLTARGALRSAAAPSAPTAAGGRGSVSPVMSLWGSLDVDVDGRDLAGLVVPLRRGVTVSGRIVFDGQTLGNPQGVLVNLTAIQGMTGATSFGGRSAADGTFAIAGVAPGRYRLTAYPAAPTTGSPWTQKAAIVDGRDVFDEPIEIRPGQSVSSAVVTLTDRISELSGTLLDAAGRPTPEYFVVMFSADKRWWTSGSRRVGQARPDNNGAFKISALPPGEYYLSALTDLDSGQLADGSFLESLVGASIKVTLGEGEKKVQNLRLAGGG